MNVVLIIVDSLRADALHGQLEDGPATPNFDWLRRSSLSFAQAMATECWTLPTHASMFSGQLPSQHRAHFQNLRCDADRMLAEVLRDDGFYTELVTRNSVLDGTIPGITRGFCKNTAVLSPRSAGADPLALMLALSKPRFRRQIKETGFFSTLQRENREFVGSFARTMLPADAGALALLLQRMRDLSATDTPFFLAANLLDVHAPYSPSLDSLFAPFNSLANVKQNVRAMQALPYLGCHAYLREGFKLPEEQAAALRERYHEAVALMDAKLGTFVDGVRALGLDRDTCLIVVSDHGEAFGEHELFLHDASVFDTHLHVPLFVMHPAIAPQEYDGIVSTQLLFDLVVCVSQGRPEDSRLLGLVRDREPSLAVAEHFFYAQLADIAPRFRQNQMTVVGRRWKYLVRGTAESLIDRACDGAEEAPASASWTEFEKLARQEGVASRTLALTREHVASWRQASTVAG